MKSVFLACGLVFAGLARASAANLPNVMILLDSSGSMADTVSALTAYYSTHSYTATGQSYTAANVYQEIGDNGSYTFYAANIAAVTSTAARTNLTTYGFWFGDIAQTKVKLFAGNYLNFQTCTTPNTCLRNQTKLSIAQRVVTNLLRSFDGSRFGLMKFKNIATTSGQIPADGASMVAAIGTATSTVIGYISTITATGYTPLGEQLRDAGYYFRGVAGASPSTFPQFPTPIQAQCQQNTTMIISDGLQNGVSDVRTEATNRYTQDHSSSLSGTQNVIVNTIGFSIIGSERDAALAVLQTAATNGGGRFYLADNTAQLEQALFSVPPALSVISPSPGATVSGTVQLSAAVSNVDCVAGVQFLIDGSSTSIPEDTSAPYQFNWDTTMVLNGTHTITAVSRDQAGVKSPSFPVTVTSNNDQDAPGFTSNDEAVGYTTATINWITDEAGDTQIQYGTTTAYGLTTLRDTNLVLSHSVPLSGLTPGTLYYYQMITRDAAGNVGTFNGTFTTLTTPGGGAHAGFRVTFAGNSGGGIPAFSAGDCVATTIEAIDNTGLHSNFTGTVTVGQYLLSPSGVETALAPGLALRSDFQLGVSTFEFSMVNGYLFLGSPTDFSRQLCFYRATREPFGTTAPGDMRLHAYKTGDVTIDGVSPDYIVWRGSPNRILLLAPDQSTAPATTLGVTGSPVPQKQGFPFVIRAVITDTYWNLVAGAADRLRFSASVPASAGFIPFEGVMSGGVLRSTATISSCAGMTLRADDLTDTSIASGQVAVTINDCSGTYFEVGLPGLVTAGQTFSMTITVKNVNTTADTPYTGTLVAKVPLDATRFGNGSGQFSRPTFSFTIASATVGDYVYTITDQSYLKAETIWAQLIADNPAALNGSSALAGPMQVLAAAPEILTMTNSPTTIPAYSVSNVYATLADRYGNGISGQTINMRLDSGTGGFDSYSRQTDAFGQASFIFRSPGISESDTFTAYVPSLTAIQTVTGSVLVSLLGDKLVAAYPSPVSISERPITFEYRLTKPGDVKLIIADAFGNQVWTKTYSSGASGAQTGFNVVTWNGRNGTGVVVAAGIYTLHIEIKESGARKQSSTRFGVRK